MALETGESRWREPSHLPGTVPFFANAATMET